MPYALSWLAGYLYGYWLELAVIAPEIMRLTYTRTKMRSGPPGAIECDVNAGVALLRHALAVGQKADSAWVNWAFQLILVKGAWYLLRAGWPQARVEAKIELMLGSILED